MPGLEELMEQVRAVFDTLTPDQQTHHRRLQKISFVTGNLSIDKSTTPFSIENLRARIETAIGPCPCADCIALKSEGPYR
jgi:hypothetical protein